MGGRCKARGEAEVLVSEDRLEVPPPVAHVMAQPQQSRIYIRKADVGKSGSTDGCARVLLKESTVLPHLESRRARIVGLMDEQGRQRIEERKRKREVVPEDKDVTAEEAAAGSSGPRGDPSYP